MMVFGYLFINHIENRVPYFNLIYKDNKYLKYIEKCFQFKKKLLEKNHLSNYYSKIKNSKFFTFFIKLYQKVEVYYLIILNEILLMFTNLISSIIGKLIFTPLSSDEKLSMMSGNEINLDEQNKKIANKSELKKNNSDIISLLKEDNNINNEKNNKNLLSELKKDNKMDDEKLLLNNILNSNMPFPPPDFFNEMLKDPNFSNMNLNDLNMMNQNLMSMKGMLGNIVNEMEKEKTL